MPDNVYYGVEKETVQGTRMSNNPLLNRPSNPNLDITIGYSKGPSLWSMLSRLFRRKAKPSVQLKEAIEPYVSIETEYNGKLYRGILYPVEEEVNANQ